MRKQIIKSLILTFALGAFGAACSPTATNTNPAMNHNGMNHSAMMNSNSMNMNGMDHSKMDHNSMNMNSNMSGMDHSAMKSDVNAAAAPYDLQFLDTMTHHHQGAVDMAKMIDGKTQNADLIKFGKQIIADQEKEIAQMKDWREKWFAGKPRAMNMEMPGMADSMKMDMAKLSGAKDKEFDLAFVEMMIPHHEGAITMSKEALTKSEKPEIKTLANQIIKAQEAEIKMMNEWKAKWAK
jgi:uncharacterized protein (DUF305 family)